MKSISSTLFLLLSSSVLFSQPLQTVKDSTLKDTTYWVQKKIVGLDITQIAFLNWNAGGNSSISGLFKGDFSRKYTKENVLWNNEMSIRYGINKQDDRELRKTDDAFSILSNYGYKTDINSNWYSSARFNFNTQFTNGYAYPNIDTPISKFFAPAYVFLGIGSEYNRKDWNANFYFSPLTLKTTFVLNQRLADLGSYGVTKAIYDEEGNLLKRGRKSRTELGMLFNNYWKTEIYKNMTLENRLSLYSDYLNNFGNIDVDWQLQVDMIVNEYVKANIGIHMIYDDDIKAKEEVNGEQITVGPKLQLKQALGIGVVYVF
ncbi:MAG TPA: DUF3078 domain-containing protein [Flavobacterium sp.]|jgi:hypothetical protein|nr:DUF3078 domain-containing protein [Flavobacterium sp.]HRZ31123.1 DUF3078 domain-containing protein [Flavobacterium sp.]HRZ73661.1 DUF3078 domain-containing protein [Flavobacterium sp.]